MILEIDFIISTHAIQAKNNWKEPDCYFTVWSFTNCLNLKILPFVDLSICINLLKLFNNRPKLGCNDPI